MTHPAVIKSAALIRAGDLAGAERALTAIAESDGDQALVAVLNDVPPKDLLAIMREFDSSKESILNSLVTPEQFANAAVLDYRYGDPTHEQLRGMMNAVLFREPDMTAEFLRALGAVTGGVRTLAYYFSDQRDGLLEFAMTGNFSGGIYGRPASPADPEDEPLDESERLVANALPNFYDETTPPKVTRIEIADNEWKESAWVLRYEVTEVFENLIAYMGDKYYDDLDARVEEARARRDEAEGKGTSDRAEPEESAL